MKKPFHLAKTGKSKMIDGMKANQYKKVAGPKKVKAKKTPKVAVKTKKK